MLIKEYRIPMPMSVDEYRIAQLYMIQKKSRKESSGSGSRVEILVNEPYIDGPGYTNGQYTHKVYHIASHLPGWIKALAPKSAQRVEEKSWNAYPYTKSIYTCPFLEKFSFEVETYYYQDKGYQDNVFNLSGDDLRRRQLDMVNIATDKLPSSEYEVSEDPVEFVSEKSGRGPLGGLWLDEWHGNIMCSYKLCKIEFRYWGMQTRVERFIAEIIRRTMLRAHRQAWCWQDEWLGLQIEDIRRLERETQSALQRLSSGEREVEDQRRKDSQKDSQPGAAIGSPVRANVPAKLSHRTSSVQSYYSSYSSGSVEGDRMIHDKSATGSPRSLSRWRLSKTGSLGRLLGQDMANMDLKEEIAALRMDAIEVDSQSESDSETDVYYDAQQELEDSQEKQMLYSSVEIQQKRIDRKSEHHHRDDQQQLQFAVADMEDDKDSSTEEDDSSGKAVSMKPLFQTLTSTSPQVETLVLIFHGGSAVETRSEVSNKNDDCQTLQSTVDEIVKKHYRFTKGHIAFRLVACPPVCKSAIELLSHVNPNPQALSEGSHLALSPHLPLVSLAIHAVSQHEYQEIISNIIDKANEEFEEFHHSEEGQDFMGTVCIVGDCMGGLLAYDALCYCDLFCHDVHSGSPSPAHSHSSSNSSPGAIGGASTSPQLTRKHFEASGGDELSKASLSMPLSIGPTAHQQKKRSFRRSCKAAKQGGDMLGVEGHAPVITGVSSGFTFEVSDLFLLGCPLGHVIAYRQLSQPSSGHPYRPNCAAVYNLFHCWDPMACRVEPLLDEHFKSLSPVAVPQYGLFPLGDGNETSHNISATVQSHPDIFVPQDVDTRPLVQVDIVESRIRNPSGQSASSMASIDPSLGPQFEAIGGPVNWWSHRRLDYSVFCPEAVESFPRTMLPMWMHASYWESMDVAAFILRTIVHERYVDTESVCAADDVVPFLPMQPRERWNHKRAGYKISSLSEYHRGHDSAVLELCPQTVSARFAYGPFDLVSLIGEAVDVYVLSPSSSNWVYTGTSDTDKKGRLQFELPQSSQLPCGVHEVKMLVRGDHTVANCSLFILQPGIEAVVFSIDGSFAGSLSIRGKKPKLRSQAVEVVRHWQELGYLIVYVTGRPDMQKLNVMMWLAQNSFPFGMVYFCNGLVREPQKHKAAFLKSLQDEVKINICSAYGSKKDIKLYTEIGISASHINIMSKGKTGSKKSTKKPQAQVFDDYGQHLEYLKAHLPPSTCPTIPMRKKSFVATKPVSLKKRKQKEKLSSSIVHRKTSTGSSSKASLKAAETSV